MTQVEAAMCCLMDVFDKYAAGEGRKNTLSKAEAKKLLTEQFPGLIQGAQNPDGVDRLLSDLDTNGDSEIEFNEFVALVANLTCFCHGRSCKN